jgi:hypothetical protein
LLALNPAGMTVRELAVALYGTAGREATVRAEIVRLRRILNDAVLSRPYRLDTRLHVDVEAVERRLAAGDTADAMRRYAGPLLPQSAAPGVVEARVRLAHAVGAEPSRPGSHALHAAFMQP